MDYKERMTRLRAGMEQQGIKAILVPGDAHMAYLTGLPRNRPGVTRFRPSGWEFSGLLVTLDEAVALMPHMQAGAILPDLDSYPHITRLVPIPDGDFRGDTFVAACRRLSLGGSRVGVMAETSASVTLVLQDELSCRVTAADHVLWRLRSVKDAGEITALEKASAMADQVFADLLPQLRAGIGVRELENEIDRLMEVHGASSPAFATEVFCHGPRSGDGLGEGSPVLYPGSVVAFDFGGVVDGYCSDFGRTVFWGDPGKELRRGHALVIQAQAAAMAAMLPHSSGTQADDAARHHLEDAGLGSHFIHRLGHGIGMDVHEPPFLSRGEDRVLLAGMCFTVEPSLFLPRKAFIRVEDVVLLEDGGPRFLSHSSRQLLVIEP